MVRYWVQVLVAGKNGNHDSFYNLDYQRMKLVPVNKRPMPMGCFIKESYLGEVIKEVQKKTSRKPLVSKLSTVQIGRILDMGQFSAMLHEENRHGK
jgi:hypothetical protein